MRVLARCLPIKLVVHFVLEMKETIATCLVERGTGIAFSTCCNGPGLKIGFGLRWWLLLLELSLVILQRQASSCK